MVQNQARNVALNIQAAGGPQSQPCVKPTAAEMEQILTATALGALETGNEEDSIREFGELNRRFPNNLTAKKHLANLIEKPTEAPSIIPQISKATKSIQKNNFSSTLEAALHL
jgi:hypothetical protein